MYKKLGLTALIYKGFQHSVENPYFRPLSKP